MTARVRALLGACLGAIAVLTANGTTRPALLAAFRPLPRGGLPSLLARPPLQKPTDRMAGAAYLHLGAERLVEGPRLTGAERASLIAVATAGERADADNAFWPLARCVFRDPGSSEAGDDWRAASRRVRYDDYQSAAMRATVDDVARKVGDTQAWIYAALARRRSQAMGIAIKRTAFRTLERLRDPQAHDEFAVETIHNGAALRNGSRQLRLAAYGIEMIEGATYPSGTSIESADAKGRIKRVWVNKGNLTRSLRDTGRSREANYCDAQFRANDSWQAFEDVTDPDGLFAAWAISGAVVAALPGAFLMASLAGGLTWLFGIRVVAVAQVRNRFRGPGLTACSLSLLAVAALLDYPWVGLTAGACALVPALGPERPRRIGDAPLGPLHAFLVGVVATGLLLGVALAAVARSLPGQILPEQGPVGAWLGDAPRMVAFLVVLLGASALIAPAYAIVRRFSTPAVSATVYPRVGRPVAILGLVLTVVASPACLALDRLIGEQLGRIALNEPRAYGPVDTGEGA